MVIENYPLQAYASALIFSPTRSLIKENFAHEEPKWIRSRPTVNDTWGGLLLTLQDEGDRVDYLSLSQDDEILAASCRNSLKFWNVTSGKCFLILDIALDNPLSHVSCMSHDGRLFAGSIERQITVWNVVDGRILSRCGKSQSYVGFAFLPTNEQIVSLLHNGVLEVWEVSTGEMLTTTQSQVFNVDEGIFSRNGEFWATASKAEETKIKILRTKSGQCLQILEFSSQKLFNYSNPYYAFSQDCKRFAASSNTCVAVWDVIDGSCIAIFDLVLEYGVNSLALSNDGTCLAFGLYGSVKFISNVLNNESVDIRLKEGDSASSILFSQDSGHLMLGRTLGSVEIWDISDLKSLWDSEPQAGFNPLSSISYNKEYSLSHFQEGSPGNTDIFDPKREETTGFSTEGISTRSFSHDNFFLALGYKDCDIRILERKSLRYLRSCDTQNEKHGNLYFSHDDTYLASISERGCFRVWEITTGACVQRFDSHSGKFTGLFFLPNQARLASKTKEGEIRIWDIINGDSVEMLRSSLVTVMRLHFSHDSRLLAAIPIGGAIPIWDTSNGKGLQMFECYVSGSYFITSLAFTCNDKYLASVWSTGDMNIWDIASGDCVQTLGLECHIYDMSFNPSGTRLLTEAGAYALDPMVKTSPSNNDEKRIRRLRQLGYGLSSVRSWITYKSEKLLWIPPQYRPEYRSKTSVQGSKIAMIHPSGRAIVFQFVESEEIINQLGSMSGKPTWHSPVEDDWIEQKAIPRKVPSAELERFRSGIVMSDEEWETESSETEGSGTMSDD